MKSFLSMVTVLLLMMGCAKESPDSKSGRSPLSFLSVEYKAALEQSAQKPLFWLDEKFSVVVYPEIMLHVEGWIWPGSEIENFEWGVQISSFAGSWNRPEFTARKKGKTIFLISPTHDGGIDYRKEPPKVFNDSKLYEEIKTAVFTKDAPRLKNALESFVNK